MSPSRISRLFTRLRQEGNGIGGLEIDFKAPCDASSAAANFGSEGFGRPNIIEADVEGGAGLCRDDIIRLVADIDGGEFQI